MAIPLRVLIVEDSEDDAMLIVRELRRGGYEPVFERVDTAEAMGEALTKKKWDFIIADYAVPYFGGLEALRLFQKTGLDIPFIIISGKVGEDTAVETMKAGAYDYVMKSNLIRLVPVVERELREAEVRRERKRTEEELHRAYDELEFRVRERTAELARANESLQTEVAERKRMEETIRQREQEFKTLAENSPDIIARFDKKLRHVYVNQAVERATGIPRDSFIGKTNAELGMPENLVSLWEKVLKVIFETGQMKIIEFDFPTPSRQAYFESRIIPEFARDGSVESALVVSRDITERKRMEEKLQESEIRYRALFEQSPDGVVVIDPHTVIAIEFNEAAHRQLGYTREEFKKLRVFDYEAKETFEDTKAHIEKVLREGRDDFETQHRTKDNKIRDIFVTVKTIELSGRVFIHSILRDITERKRIEEALRENQKLLQSTMDYFPTVIAYKDREGRFLDVNRIVENVLGMTKEQIRGLTDYDLFPQERADIYRKHDLEVMESRQPMQREEITELPGGNLYHLDISFPLIDPEERVYGVGHISHDITELKRAENELRKRTEDLARANAELEQFTYIAAHDLQEPLRMISIFTQLLAKRYKGRFDKDADEFITYIVDGAKHMQQMIEDLLAYSRIGTRGKPFEPTNSEAAFDRAVSNLKMAIEENNAQVTHDSLPTVMADASQMVELFQNLINNAIKFRREEPHIHVSVEKKGNEWVFSVRDNGIGVSPEFMGRLFKIFQREYVAKYPGTGIGLAICKRIVERHGGRIWAESEQGKGSIFHITIPERRSERK